MKILNKRYETRSFKLSLEGLPGAALTIVGQENVPEPKIDVVPDDLRSLRVYVTVPAAAMGKLKDEVAPFTFVVEDTGDDTQTRRDTTFRTGKS